MMQRIENNWITNFKKSDLVKNNKYYKELGRGLFEGYALNNEFPAEFMEGFLTFHNNFNFSEPELDIDKFLDYLHFIGVSIRKEAITTAVLEGKCNYRQILNKALYLFKQLSFNDESLNIEDPYFDNKGDLFFFLQLEANNSSDSTQITLFEEIELSDLHNKYIELPEGYENDNIAITLFDEIEYSNDSYFITGKAGTGKSTFVQYFSKNSNKRVLLTAFTGIAAINVGGVTLHSFFHLPLRPFLSNDEGITKFNKFSQKYKIIQAVDTIIIDEVSMLRSDLLEAVDYSLRINGGDTDLPFGGKQILFVGDIFQLPPVLDNTNSLIRELFTTIYKSEYFFSSPAYIRLSPNIIELTNVHRQKNYNFISLLDSVRLCKITNDQLSVLNKQYKTNISFGLQEFKILLTSTNSIANEENIKRLEKLPYRKHTFESKIEGEFSEDKYPTLKFLELKRGAQVMFVQNDSYLNGRRWVNGTIGVIDFISENLIEISLPNGSTYNVERVIWENRKYSWNKSKKKITSVVIGTFTQFPVKLAWAITIHKSQGLTFDNVVIDMGTGAFVNGQTYTALSRCRTIEGITLRNKIKQNDLIIDERLLSFYKKILNNKLQNLLPTSNINVEDLVKNNWWINIPDTWKDLILFNIDFTPRLKIQHEYQKEDSLKNNYFKIVGKPYYKKPQSSPESIITSLIKLDTFYIDEYYSNLINTFSPLSIMKNLKTLRIFYNNTKLTHLRLLTNLSTLEITHNQHDLNPINKLINLKELELHDNKADLVPIAELNKLKILKLFSNSSDLKPIVNLHDLEHLDLSYNQANIYPILNLKNLRSLNLSNNYSFDLFPVHFLRNLIELNITSSNDLSDLSYLVYLSNLKTLYIGGNHLTNLTPLARLTKLSSLTINYNQADLNPIGKLTNLTSLRLFNNSADLNPLKTLSNLLVLDLDNNFNFNKKDPTYLSIIANFSNLTELSIRDNNLEDINFLTKIKKLRKLYLTNNYKLSDLKPISSLINLEELILFNNRFSDITPLSKLKKLKSLTLHSTIYFSNLNSLSNLENLTRLVINGEYYNLNFLNNLTELSSLTIVNKKCEHSNDIIDLEPLSNLKKLRELKIDDNKANLRTMPRLNNLIVLDLKNYFGNLNFLIKCKNLENLSLSSAPSNLSPLVKLPNLSILYLDISYNRVLDLTQVTKFKRLNKLFLIGTENDFNRRQGTIKKIEKLGCEVIISKTSGLRDIPQ